MTSSFNLFGIGRSIQNAKVQSLYVKALYARNRLLPVQFRFIWSIFHSCTISDVFTTEVGAYYVLDHEIPSDKALMIRIEMETSLNKSKLQ
jgi:hypothetical protein